MSGAVCNPSGWHQSPWREFVLRTRATCLKLPTGGNSTNQLSGIFRVKTVLPSIKRGRRLRTVFSPRSLSVSRLAPPSPLPLSLPTFFLLTALCHFTTPFFPSNYRQNERTDQGQRRRQDIAEREHAAQRETGRPCFLQVLAPVTGLFRQVLSAAPKPVHRDKDSPQEAKSNEQNRCALHVCAGEKRDAGLVRIFQEYALKRSDSMYKPLLT